MGTTTTHPATPCETCQRSSSFIIGSPTGNRCGTISETLSARHPGRISGSESRRQGGTQPRRYRLESVVGVAPTSVGEKPREELVPREHLVLNIVPARLGYRQSRRTSGSPKLLECLYGALHRNRWIIAVVKRPDRHISKPAISRSNRRSVHPAGDRRDCCKMFGMRHRERPHGHLRSHGWRWPPTLHPPPRDDRSTQRTRDRVLRGRAETR